MNEQIVKLQRFWCSRDSDDDQQMAEAERVLREAGAEHHGALWADVEKLYTVSHFTQGRRRASALVSVYEHTVLCG